MSDNYGCPIREGSTGAASACPIHGQHVYPASRIVYTGPVTSVVDHNVRIDELSALRAENEALTRERDAMKRDRDAAFAKATGFWRERDELAAALDKALRWLRSVAAILRCTGSCRSLPNDPDAPGEFDDPKAILDARDKALVQKYKDRMIHASWPLAATALFSDDPAELSLCRMEVDQALAALVKPLVEALGKIKRLSVRFDATWQILWEAIKIADAALAAYKSPCPRCRGTEQVLTREYDSCDPAPGTSKYEPCPDCAGGKKE